MTITNCLIHLVHFCREKKKQLSSKTFRIIKSNEAVFGVLNVVWLPNFKSWGVVK